MGWPLRSALAGAVCLAYAAVALAAPVRQGKPGLPSLGGPPPPVLKGPPPPVFKSPPPPAFASYASPTYMPLPTPRLRLGSDPAQYDDLIREIAGRHGVEFALVKAVIKAESDFDRLAVSPKGAQGLMQLMPQTAALHRVRNVFGPRDNIEGGCRHLRMLLDRYRGNFTLAVAAYNAGAERVEAARGIPAIDETREYTARVLTYRTSYLRRPSH
jgi:soluble lytic murein transglycosylase-like protein